MLKHHHLLQQDNLKLQEQNRYLELLVKDAEEKVKELSSTLQKGLVNVMPSVTVCNDLLEISKDNREVHPTTGFASAGSVTLDAPALCLDDGVFIAAGQTNGAISLWSAQQPDGESNSSSKQKNRNSSGTLYRFSTEKSIMDAEEKNPIVKQSNPLVGHRGPVTSVKWIDNVNLSSVSLDATLKIWDVTTAKYNSIALDCPSVSHTIVDNCFAIASCTNKIFFSDPKDPTVQSIENYEIVTSIAKTNLGLLIGTENGKILVIDPRMWKPYQSIQLSQAELPISKISGVSEITVTSFDGIVRTIGNELPLFVEKEFVRAPIMGSIIGSCCVSISSKNDFVVSGSTDGRAIVWPKNGPAQNLSHKGSIVYDCANVGKFVGSFITCDNASNLTMWACSFNEMIK